MDHPMTDPTTPAQLTAALAVLQTFLIDEAVISAGGARMLYRDPEAPADFYVLATSAYDDIALSPERSFLRAALTVLQAAPAMLATLTDLELKLSEGTSPAYAAWLLADEETAATKTIRQLHTLATTTAIDLHQAVRLAGLLDRINAAELALDRTRTWAQDPGNWSAMDGRRDQILALLGPTPADGVRS
jgi:hypothetical protein